MADDDTDTQECTTSWLKPHPPGAHLACRGCPNSPTYWRRGLSVEGERVMARTLPEIYGAAGGDGR